MTASSTSHRKSRVLAAAAACLALAGAARAQSAQDLVILPAPADAWRTIVGQWAGLAELTGDSVVAPPPGDSSGSSHVGASARSQGGQRAAVLFEWKDVWSSMLRFESRRPLDLGPYRGGTLEFDLDVAELSKGGLRAKVGCGEGCDRSVNLIDTARAWAGKGWQHVVLSMDCFVREGADFSKVGLPFSLEGAGSGRVSVSNVRITRRFRPGLACPDYRTESFTPAMLNESFAMDWWAPRHEAKLEEKRRLLATGTPPGIVFIGDSITQGWENEGRDVWERHYASLHALDLGFGGDRTENVLWRLQHGEVDGLSPKVAVLMIGTNNSGMRSPESTAAGFRHLLDEIRRRLPRTKVLMLAIFPRGEKPDDSLRIVNERVNRLIAGYADGRNVHFLDINAQLLGPDGTLSRDVMPDLLHPNAKGYAIWQRAMDPVLQKLLASR